MVSFVIAYHNEGQEFLNECVRQLHRTCRLDAYEVIVVDDGSDIPLGPTAGTVVRNEEKKGVGKVFDIGIAHAVGDTIIMLGCDIRFNDNDWARILEDDADRYQDAIICTECLSLKKDRLSFAEAKNRSSGHGCDLLLRYKNNILMAQWALQRGKGIYPVPVVMGACYAFKKRWYEHIDGWSMFRDKGTLEAFLSIKSWIFGGKCLVDRRAVTGHIYRDKDEHGRTLDNELYNKLLLDYWFFGSSLKDYIEPSNSLESAKRMFGESMEDIEIKKTRYDVLRLIDQKDYLDNYLFVNNLINHLKWQTKDM